MSYNTIAQPFTQPVQQQAAGLELFFTAAGGDAVVYLATVDERGNAEQMLAEARVLKANIKTDGSATRVAWEQPVMLQAGSRYALGVACGDEQTALQCAQVGEATKAGGQVTTAQANIGNLMRINPSGVATTYDGRMLRFNLLSVAYKMQEKTVVLGTVPVQNATALTLAAGSTQPEATARISYKLELINGGVIGSTYEVDAGQPVKLDALFNGDVRVSAVLTVGKNGLGAVLEPGTMLLVGTLKTEGTYITPAISAGGGTDLRVIYEGEVPAGASVVAHVQTDGAGSWKIVPFDSGTNAAGVVEVSHRLQALAGTAHRLRLTLTGSTSARPKVRNLRAVILG
ncbi:virulence-associated protein [Comamonas sp. J-3]|uniref:virulence-associated protein n=1 Tax=Comamonas trifloxystrobinivorans TaxID=3350256 RepID=UPI00372BBDAB